jgi:hypothetical protein
VGQEFKKAFRGIDAAIKQGTARALNRALSSTKTKVVRQLREETGLKTDIITERMRARKANQSRLDAIIAIATKVGVALGRFNARPKTVRVAPRGAPKKRSYEGVSVKIGKQPRQLAPGAFFLKGKRTDGVVIQRKGLSKYPTFLPRVPIYGEVAAAHREENARHMRDTFEKNVAHEIDYAIQRKFSSNK